MVLLLCVVFFVSPLRRNQFLNYLSRVLGAVQYSGHMSIFATPIAEELLFIAAASGSPFVTEPVGSKTPLMVEFPCVLLS